MSVYLTREVDFNCIKMKESVIKGRVSRFSACASDDLSAVKIIVYRPIRSAFTTI